MANDDNKKIFGEVDDFNNMSANNDILDLDEPEKKFSKKATKKPAKKAAKKKASVKKTTKAKKASKTSTKKSAEKKSTSKKTAAKKKVTKKNTVTQRKSQPKTIGDELLKVTNIKSVEQVKKPRKIALMVSFYAVIVIAIIVFCLIKFSKPNKNNLLLKETINYEYLTEKVEPTTKRIIVESSSDKEGINSENDNEKDATKETTKESETTNRLLELTTKSANSYKEITEKEETTKRQVEATEAIVTKAWPTRTSINEILPRYKDIIYPYSIYNQMTMEELGIVNSALSNNYNVVKDKVFGEDVTFANKGMNGIIYLNYTYLQDYLSTYAGGTKQNYDNLPYAPYYNYIMNDKFHFDFKTYTTNLSMRLDFKNAKNNGEYFEVPATIFEPAGANVSANAYNKFNVRVLKNAKIGYTESFSLTALLEVLDIECNTKHNPFFSIEDVIGANPKVIEEMRESGFDVRSMIDEEVFNYVLFDKKGYIAALYMLKS